MNGFGKFCVASFVSFFCMVGALGSPYSTLLIGLAFVVWFVFIWSVSGSSKKRGY
jgi:hypothetical protein